MRWGKGIFICSRAKSLEKLGPEETLDQTQRDSRCHKTANRVKKELQADDKLANKNLHPTKLGLLNLKSIKLLHKYIKREWGKNS